MIGTPPSGRRMRHDPAAHPTDFAGRYSVALDQYTTIRTEELGVPRDRIGSSDHDHGIEWCSFNPHEDTGGGVGTRGQVNIGSGNPLTQPCYSRGISSSSVNSVTSIDVPTT